MISRIEFNLILSHTSKIPPEGYLFLCPLADLQSEDLNFVERSECPAYWSLDPSGNKRLCSQEASTLGFPSLHWERKIWCRSWSSRVYAGLSQFHAGKGFDPNSQDIARHLEYPLYVLSRDPSLHYGHGKYLRLVRVSVSLHQFIVEEISSGSEERLNPVAAADGGGNPENKFGKNYINYSSV